jgi:hypothetical protein
VTAKRPHVAATHCPAEHFRLQVLRRIEEDSVEASLESQMTGELLADLGIILEQAFDH